jgi:hypothetical protein
MKTILICTFLTLIMIKVKAQEDSSQMIYFNYMDIHLMIYIGKMKVDLEY